MGAPEPFGFDATSLLVATDARRFTQSTMSYVSMAGLTVSLNQLISLSARRIEAHAEALASLLVDKLATSGWHPFRNPAEASASPHIISIVHETRSHEIATTMLRERGIVCGTRGGRIRVSLAPYNDESDVQVLVETLVSG